MAEMKFNTLWKEEKMICYYKYLVVRVRLTKKSHNLKITSRKKDITTKLCRIKLNQLWNILNSFKCLENAKHVLVFLNILKLFYLGQ